MLVDDDADIDVDVAWTVEDDKVGIGVLVRV